VAAKDNDGSTPLHQASENGHLDASSSTAPTQQPRTDMGGFRCIEHLRGAIWMWHGSSSSAAPTWQPRTKTNRLRYIGRPKADIWTWHGSSLSTAPTRYPGQYGWTPLPFFCLREGDSGKVPVRPVRDRGFKFDLSGIVKYISVRSAPQLSSQHAYNFYNKKSFRVHDGSLTLSNQYHRKVT